MRRDLVQGFPLQSRNQYIELRHHNKLQSCYYIHFRTNTLIGLYTPINYFGRYATCSHNKDGGRSHIQSRETIGQENHMTCLKLRQRVNFRPAFGVSYKTRIFYKYVVFRHPLSFTKFLRSGNTLPPV